LGSSAVAHRTRCKVTRPPSNGWWGNGPAPWERWPGVTLPLEANWCSLRDRWESLDGRYWFKREVAQTACEFFPEMLKHHKGEFGPSPEWPEGQPFFLLPYQDQLIVRPLFGWMRADGLRRFRKVFLAVPKGSGKSPLGSGIALYLTYCDGELGAEVYSAAADREQAAIVFDTAKIMVEANPDLNDLSTVMRRAIEVPSTHSYYRVLSADVKGKHGPNIHGLIFDEFHAQPSRELYEVLHRGTVKRRQPVTVMITTAGDDDESICAEEWDYARKVMSGSYTDPSYLPVIFEASKDDNWKDPEVWKRVNPGYGVTVKADALETEALQAANEPRKLNDFLRYHLNRWVNQATAWIPIDWWDACPATLPENLSELRVFGGLDMTQKIDLAAFDLVFLIPHEGAPLEVKAIGTDEAGPVEKSLSFNYSIAIVPHFWIPEETMREHIKTDKVRYDIWEEEGLITATEGNVIDYDRIFKDITGPITDRFPKLKEAQIGFDPAFATDIAQKLMGKGYQMVEVLQNYQRLSESCHLFEALVKGQRVFHGGHRILRNHMENVAIKQDDAGRIRPIKPKRRAKRIDGVVASLMGLSRAIVAEPESSGGWNFLSVE
jgi:phage terminase large subunit-like protein